MAVIGSIRKRVGLLIGFIGVSLVLFILGDVLTNNSSFFSGTTDVVGEIGGTKVRYQEYERKVAVLTENYKTNTQNDNIDPNTQDMLREQAWGVFVNENVLGKEYEKIGLSCSAEELYDMCVGKNPNAQVKQAFTDPKTGQFDPNSVVKFLRDLPNREEKIQRQWRTFEDAIREDRIAEKYRKMMRNGIFATTEEAKRNNEEQTRAASIRYVRLDYNTVPDTAVNVDNSDLEKYYDENKNKYRQTETIRKIEYVAFDIAPSDDDRNQATTWIEEKKSELAAATNDIQFVNQNSDSPFDSAYYPKGALRTEIDTALFNAPVGTITGPYMDGNSLKVAKLVSTRMIPDSVKARHILLPVENGDTAKALARADSIKSAIKKGSKFDALARQLSTDPGSGSKGGDLGWFRQGAMVKPFNDACFEGKKGDLPVVVSEFGVHLIEILDKGVPSKQIQVAIVERKVESSQRTYDIMYNKAYEFASKNNTGEQFDSAVVKQGLNKRIADNVRENDKNIPGLDQPRELVRWAYGAKKGDVSNVFTFGEKYVIAHLTEIREKGFLPLELVKDQVTAEVKKQKKAEMLMEKFNNAGKGSIDDIAQKLNSPAADADNVLLGNVYIPGLGNESALVGTIFAMKPNEVTPPVKGESGVTVALVKSFSDAKQIADLSSETKKIAQQKQERSEYEVFNALKEKANVEDNRGKFF